jgi:predicted nucleic acid-binding protein
MKPSTEPRPVILDANALSRLAHVQQTELLPRIFPGRCFLAPAVYREIEAGVGTGVAYLEPILALVKRQELKVLDIEPEDREYSAALPRKLGLGEAEGIALCRSERWLKRWKGAD